MQIISVIILAFNGESFIEKCIESVVNQTIGIQNIEIIIADDASTDGTVDILKKYQKKYPQSIKPVLYNTNSWVDLRNNRDMVIKEARGKYIMFLDQDDWYELNALETLLNYMENNCKLDYIEYAYYFHTDNKRIAKSVNGEGFNIYEISCEKDRNNLIKSRVLPGYATVWNKIYKKEFILNNEIKHTSKGRKAGFGDNLFSGLSVLYTQCMATLNIPLYNYCLHEKNESKKASFQFDRLKIGLFFWEEVINRDLIQEKKEAAEYMFFQIYLLKTFWKFLLQYPVVPYQEMINIQKNIREKTPKYRENFLLSNHSEMSDFFEILDKDWTVTYLEELRRNVLLEIDNKDFYKQLYLITDFQATK